MAQISCVCHSNLVILQKINNKEHFQILAIFVVYVIQI